MDPQSTGLRDLAALLRANRPEPTPLQLDHMKRRVSARMRDSPRARRPAHTQPSDRGPADALLALLLAGLTVYLAFRNGGFFPGTAALAAVEVALCIAVLFVIARSPWGGVGIPLILATVAIGGLAAWTLASSDWSGTPIRAMIEYTRVLLYALTLILFGLLGFSRRRVRWMVYAMAAAAVAVCCAALIARTLPEVIFHEDLIRTDRLGFPLNYWNGLAFMACVGIVFCVHLACSIRDRWFVRVVGAAAVPLLSATLYYTLSRGGTWAGAGAVVLYLVVGRPRAMLSGLLATVPPVAFMLLALDPADALTQPIWGTPETVAAGEDAARAIALAAVGAAALRAALLPLDGLARSLTLPQRAQRPAIAAATVAAVAVTLGGALAFDVPNVVSEKYSEFKSRDELGAPLGTDRLLSADSSGRQDHWDVAMAAYRRDRFHGSGAGMFSSDWARDREQPGSVQDAHSFYIELLGELGWPGLAMGALALVIVLGGFAFRARGRDRALFAALLAAGIAWAAQASVDWLWEMPAVTLWLFAFGGAVLARNPTSPSTLPAWTIGVRAAGVALCLVLVLLPARIAVSEARLSSGLDAVEAGRCDLAKQEAKSALSAVPERASPYHLRAFCDFQRGDSRQAVRAMANAVERDPSNWKLHYGLAVARSAAGLDPRPRMRRALMLNPLEGLVQEGMKTFGAETKGRWRRAGAKLALPAPGPPTP